MGSKIDFREKYIFLGGVFCGVGVDAIGSVITVMAI
jgi:hypothetical protein